MTHTTPLSTIVFQKPDGTSGELDVHDNEAIHDEASSVKETNIANGAVTTDKIANNAVTTTKIANGAVDTINVADGAITKDKLDNEITEYWDSQFQEIQITSGITNNRNISLFGIYGNEYIVVSVLLPTINGYSGYYAIPYLDPESDLWYAHVIKDRIDDPYPPIGIEITAKVICLSRKQS